MSRKVKLIIIFFLLLDISYITLKGLNLSFLNLPNIKGLLYDKSSYNSSIFNGIEPPPFEYGKKLENHFIEDIYSNAINVSENNKCFKLIRIVQSKNTDNINIDSFINFVELQNDISNRDILYVYIISSNESNKITENLKYLQNKYNIAICQVSTNFLKKVYNISNFRCEYNMLLDNNNNIRLNDFGLDNELIREIVQYEFSKGLLREN